MKILCARKHLNPINEHVQDELHIAPSDIYSQECDRVVQFCKVPRIVVGLYIKSYSHKKNTFIKL